MSIQQMRSAIAKVYPGEKWQKKVAKMKDPQVLAVYNRMLEAKQLS